VERPRVGLGVALLALLRQRAFGLLIVSFALVSLANWGIYGWLPTYLREHFKLGLGAAGLAATGYVQLASFAGVLIGPAAFAAAYGGIGSYSQTFLLVPGVAFAALGLLVLARSAAHGRSPR